MPRFTLIDLDVSPHSYGRHRPLSRCNQVDGAVVDRVRGSHPSGQNFIWIDRDRRRGHDARATVAEFVATHIVSSAGPAAAGDDAAAVGVASAADFVGAPLPCKSRGAAPPGSPC